MRIDPFVKSYDFCIVLDFPGFFIDSGKIYAVIGSNGCGKSTLAKVISGVEPADNGFLAISKHTDIGYMPQTPYAFYMSLYQNVLLGGGDPKRAKTLIDTMGLTALIQKSGKTLSGGETARMALVRTMLQKHDVLLLDEPCASMDIQSTMLAEGAIRQYHLEFSAAVILITHNIKQAARIADEILFLSDGQLIECGAADALLHDPKKEETKRFLDFYAL